TGLGGAVSGDYGDTLGGLTPRPPLLGASPPGPLSAGASPPGPLSAFAERGCTAPPPPLHECGEGGWGGEAPGGWGGAAIRGPGGGASGGPCFYPRRRS